MIAVLADIHGNLHALEAVLADMPAVTEIWSLGDMLTGPPFPCEVLERLLNMPVPVHAVLGNHEEFLLEIRRTRGDKKWRGKQFGGFPIVVDSLNSEHWAYIESLKISKKIPEKNALIFHGTPENSRGKILSETDAKNAAENRREQWLIGGHTHSSRFFRAGTKKIITAGSVGMPLDGIGGVASYVLIDENTSAVAFRAVSYDVDAAIRAMHNAGFTELAPVISKALIAQLRTGRNYIEGLVRHVLSYAERQLGYKPNEIPNEIWEEAEKTWLVVSSG